MKKPTKRLALTTQTIRLLQTDELGSVHGGSIVGSGTSVISASGTSVLSGPSVIQPGTTVISGPSVISRH